MSDVPLQEVKVKLLLAAASRGRGIEVFCLTCYLLQEVKVKLLLAAADSRGIGVCRDIQGQ